MFDKELALELAKLSQLVYSGYTDIEKEFHNTPAENKWRFFDSKGSQGLIVEYPDKICVAFRGTGGEEGMTVADFCSDINVRKVNIPGVGNLHKGFYEALQLISPNMIKYLKIIITSENPRNLYLTGHSLGAVMATDFILDLEKAEIDWDDLYTYGSPRGGDEQFAKYVNSKWKDKIFRLVNDRDIVTRLPYRVMGYSHVGTIVAINRDGKISVGDTDFWDTFWERNESLLKDLEHLRIIRNEISDHFIENYIQALETA